MKSLNESEMRTVDGGSLIGLVLGWTAVNVVIQMGAFALSYHFGKIRR